LAQENTGDTMKFEVASRLDDLFGETESSGADEELVPEDPSIEIESSGVDEELVLDGLFNEPESTGTNENTVSKESIQNNLIEPEEIEVLEIHEEGIEMNESHPLEDLKSTVLSIDWEITDEVMGRFVDQVEELKREFKNNKIYLLFLQLLGSVGVYIKINRGKADPEAFKVLGSAFKAFDDVVSSNNMPDLEKKKRLAVELEKFKELKIKIAAKKSAKKKAEVVEAVHIPKAPVKNKISKPVIKDEHIELVVETSSNDSNNHEEVQEIVLNPIEAKPKINSQDIISEVLVEMKKFIRGEFDDLREELKLRKKRQ